jgi:shikimate dehydrogenase
VSGDRDNRMTRACVIGWPIAHSRSPLIHGYWLRRHGVDGEYVKEAVHPGRFADFIRNLERNGFAGANITTPHKEDAYRLADEADDAARTVEAANTLWLENGRLMASNTDVYGFLRNLDERAPGWDAGASTKCAAILGAGGAARAVVQGVLDRGFENIRLINRTRTRSEALARKFGARFQLFDWSDAAAALEDCALLVNATSLGMTGAAPLNLDISRLPADAVVNDIVYAPLETPLLRDALKRELTCTDGLGMLLHQAVPGFEKWFGVRPEVTDELRALVVRDIEAHDAAV